MTIQFSIDLPVERSLPLQQIFSRAKETSLERLLPNVFIEIGWVYELEMLSLIPTSEMTDSWWVIQDTSQDSETQRQILATFSTGSGEYGKEIKLVGVKVPQHEPLQKMKRKSGKLVPWYTFIFDFAEMIAKAAEIPLEMKLGSEDGKDDSHDWFKPTAFDMPHNEPPKPNLVSRLFSKLNRNTGISSDERSA